jgi:hypothetical protein
MLSCALGSGARTDNAQQPEAVPPMSAEKALLNCRNHSLKIPLGGPVPMPFYMPLARRYV